MMLGISSLSIPRRCANRETENLMVYICCGNHQMWSQSLKSGLGCSDMLWFKYRIWTCPCSKWPIFPRICWGRWMKIMINIDKLLGFSFKYKFPVIFRESLAAFAFRWHTSAGSSSTMAVHLPWATGWDADDYSWSVAQHGWINQLV